MISYMLSQTTAAATAAATSMQLHATKIKYRCKADIIATILETAAGGEVPKSRIYYKSFLTYQRLRVYMTLLLESGLMECCDYKDKRFYKTTEKGILFLHAYSGVRELID
jgi:predicted transcriptional regulator